MTQNQRTRRYLRESRWTKKYNRRYIDDMKAEGYTYTERSLVAKLKIRMGGKHADEVLRREAWQDEMASLCPGNA